MRHVSVDTARSQRFVSIHAPVWGATTKVAIANLPICFNPRTRVGCDGTMKDFGALLDVSIHAPVWGATISHASQSSYHCFNPRTRVGCDAIMSLTFNQQEFQSTHPCGVRRESARLAISAPVSIHAPVWGATKNCLIVMIKLEFQSTHPCGVRRRACYFYGLVSCFNPRTRVGCDVRLIAGSDLAIVSIHAPVWGATKSYLVITKKACFNPRTRVGCYHRLT